MSHNIVLEEITVTSLTVSKRIYEYLPNKFTAVPTRKGIKKALKQKRILLNGEVAFEADLLNQGDQIQLLEKIIPPTKHYRLSLKVLYEDDHLAVVLKPPGIPTSGNTFKTLENALMGNLEPSTSPDALPWPLPAHRLDKGTRGLIIVAKSYIARIKLGEQFQQKQIQKTYHAIVQGYLNCTGELNASIQGKEALTLLQTKKITDCSKNGHLTLVQLHPLTGRKHQLRIHLAGIGYPILGDTLHGDKENTLLHKGLFLQSSELQFNHPITSETVHLAIPLPHKFLKRIL